MTKQASPKYAPEVRERAVRGLRQANEILRKLSAYFAQAELDRPFKKRSPSSTRIAPFTGSRSYEVKGDWNRVRVLVQH
jgi:hypothetical protein